MQGSVTPAASSPSKPLRLFIAFLLGLPLGLVTAFSLQASAPQLWTQLIPAIVLAGAMILSILLDSSVRQGIITPGRTVLSIALVLLLAVVVFGVIVKLPALNQNLNFFNLALIPLGVGLATAFAAGSDGTWRLALGSALLGWLGTGIPTAIGGLVDYIIYEQKTPGGDGGLVLPFTLVYVIVGFVFAALGGPLGKLIRSWFLGSPATVASS